MTCPESEVTGVDGEFPFLCGLVAVVSVTLALVVLLCYRCSSRVEPAARRVHRVRLSHREDVETEGDISAQSRISDRGVVSW